MELAAAMAGHWRRRLRDVRRQYLLLRQVPLCGGVDLVCVHWDARSCLSAVESVVVTAAAAEAVTSAQPGLSFETVT